MKIGIMSMQRIHNYGSFLQAYGLKKILESLGHEVQFVDYLYEEGICKKTPKKKFIKKLWNNKNVFEYIKKRLISKKYNKAFSNEFIPQLVGNHINIHPKNLETLVIGSDEVFNCLQGYPVGFSLELFGKNYESIPVISYAASFGQTNYERLVKHNVEKTIGECLKKFKAISVRDKNSYDLVEKLTGISPQLNLDPVLIYDFSQYFEPEKINLKNYIILYVYPGRLTNEEEKYIKQFAKKHKKKILSFGMYQKIANINIVVNPFEIFNYFLKADYVITDTFHGTIFSIVTQKKFCTIIRNNNEGNSNKLTDLLFRIKQDKRIVKELSDIDKIYERKIDFKETEKIIGKERKKTFEYFKKAFEK